MAVERDVPDGESDLTGLIEKQPIGAIGPVVRKKQKKAKFWPETTPVSGMTPRLPDAD